jgi:hypothetical protein
MSTSASIQLPQSKLQLLKGTAQVKPPASPQPPGLSRQELRRIVIAMIG